MATIKQLSEADIVENGDQFPFFSEAQGDTRKVTFATLKDSVATDFVSADALAAQTGATLVGCDGGTTVQQELDAKVSATLDTDGTLAANSDARVASQRATKTYADTKVATATLAASSGSSLVGHIASGTGAAARTVQARLRDIASVADYDTLANAKTGAGIRPLVDATNGRLWHFGVISPIFDEAANALGRGIAFDNNGTGVTIPASKQWNFIGIRNGSGDINFTIGSGGEASGLTYYMNSTASSHASSNMYGVIGYVANSGPGTTKGLYGRANAKSGMTGDVVGGVFRAQLDTGSNAANSYAIQMGHAGDAAKALTGVVLIDTEAASGQAAYGVLSANTMSYTTSFIRACTGGGGKFLQWQASGGGIDLFHVDQLGMIYTYSQAGNTKMLDLQNGGRINFTATAGSATAGASGAPPAQVDQYIKILVGGVEKLLPVYNP